jgi:hypothetical protein
LARLNHADNARVITTGILRQNPEKIAETSSGEVSPLNWSGFHTVWLNFEHNRTQIAPIKKALNPRHYRALSRSRPAAARASSVIVAPASMRLICSSLRLCLCLGVRFQNVRHAGEMTATGGTVKS